VNSVLGDSQRKRELETRAYEYGKEMAWPAIGRRVLALMSDILDHRIAPDQVEPVAPPPGLRAMALEEQLEDEPTPIG